MQWASLSSTTRVRMPTGTLAKRRFSRHSRVRSRDFLSSLRTSTRDEVAHVSNVSRPPHLFSEVARCGHRRCTRKYGHSRALAREERESHVHAPRGRRSDARQRYARNAVLAALSGATWNTTWHRGALSGDDIHGDIVPSAATRSVAR